MPLEKYPVAGTGAGTLFVRKPTRNLCKCKGSGLQGTRRSIPGILLVPGTFASSVRPWHTRGTVKPFSKNSGAGTGTTFVYLPGTSVSSLTFAYPYPELLQVKRLCTVGYVQKHTPGFTRTRNFCKFCTTFVPVPGTSSSSVRPWHNTRATTVSLVMRPFYAHGAKKPFLAPGCVQGAII